MGRQGDRVLTGNWTKVELLMAGIARRGMIGRGLAKGACRVSFLKAMGP